MLKMRQFIETAINLSRRHAMGDNFDKHLAVSRFCTDCRLLNLTTGIYED